MKEPKTNLSKCFAISIVFMNSVNPHLYGTQPVEYFSDEDQQEFSHKSKTKVQNLQSQLRNFSGSTNTIEISDFSTSRTGNTFSPQTKKFAEREKDIEVLTPPLVSGSRLMEDKNVREGCSSKKDKHYHETNQKKKSHKKPRIELSKSPSPQTKKFAEREKDIEVPAPALVGSTLEGRAHESPSPQLRKFADKDIPVLLLDEPIDKDKEDYPLSRTEDLDKTIDQTINPTLKNDKEITNNVNKRHSHSEESQERNAYDENNDHYKIQDIKTQIKIDYINGVLCDEKIKVLQGSKYLHLYSIHPPQGIKDSRYFKNSALIVSPDTINPEVEIIKFQLCRLRDDYIKDINKLKKIKHLEIILCGITDLGVEYITQLSDLERLNLNSNKITDVGVKSISKLTKLKSLNLSINNNITYESVSLLKDIKSLEELNIEHTNISPSEYHEISGWRNWKILEYFPLNIKHM